MAYKLWQETEHPNIYEAEAGLAAAAAELGKLDEARTHVDSALAFAHDGNLIKVVEPPLYLLNCASALRHLDEPQRVREALQLGATWIDTIASRISDPTMRKTYRDTIPQHIRLRTELTS